MFEPLRAACAPPQGEWLEDFVDVVAQKFAFLQVADAVDLGTFEVGKDDHQGLPGGS